MKPNKADLNSTLDAIAKKHGSKVIGKLSQSGSKSIAFGYPQLDASIGGAPRGRITEIVGNPTSGATTLALKVLCAAQSAGELGIYFDLSATFDPDYALGLGLHSETLLLVRPENRSDALDLLFDIATSGVPGVLVINSVSSLNSQEQSLLASVLERLNPSLSHSGFTLLLIKHAQAHGTYLSQYASLRLLIEFSTWLVRDSVIYGYEAKVTVLKSKSPVHAENIKLEIMLDDKSNIGGKA